MSVKRTQALSSTSAPISAYTQVGKSLVIARNALQVKQGVYRKNGVKIASEGERLSRFRKVLNAFIKFRLSFTSQSLRNSRQSLDQARKALVQANKHVAQDRLPFELFLKVMDDSKPQESVLDQVHNAAQAAATISWTDFAHGVENFVFDLVSGESSDSKDVSASPKPESDRKKKRDTLKNLMEGKPVTLKELEEFREYLPVMAALQEREKLLKGAEEKLLAKSKDKEASLGDKIQALATLAQQMNQTKIDVKPYGEINLTTFAAQYEALSPKTQECIEGLLKEVKLSPAYTALKEFGKERPDLGNNDAVEALLADEKKQKGIKDFLEIYEKHGETIASLAQDLPELTQMSQDAKRWQKLAREDELKPLSELRDICTEAKSLQDWKGQWDAFSAQKLSEYSSARAKLDKQNEQLEQAKAGRNQLATVHTSAHEQLQKLEKEASPGKQLQEQIEHKNAYQQSELDALKNEIPEGEKLPEWLRQAEGAKDLKELQALEIVLQSAKKQRPDQNTAGPITDQWAAADEEFLQTYPTSERAEKKQSILEARQAAKKGEADGSWLDGISDAVGIGKSPSSLLKEWDASLESREVNLFKDAFPQLAKNESEIEKFQKDYTLAEQIAKVQSFADKRPGVLERRSGKITEKDLEAWSKQTRALSDLLQYLERMQAIKEPKTQTRLPSDPRTQWLDRLIAYTKNQEELINLRVKLNEERAEFEQAAQLLEQAKATIANTEKDLEDAKAAVKEQRESSASLRATVKRLEPFYQRFSAAQESGEGTL